MRILAARAISAMAQPRHESFWLGTPDGPLQLSWKAVLHEEGPSQQPVLAWELRRVIMNFPTAAQDTNKFLRIHRATWESYLEAANLSWEDAILPSRNAWRARHPGVEMPPWLMDEFQITNIALLNILFCMVTKSRKQDSRANAFKILGSLLKKTCPDLGDEADPLVPSRISLLCEFKAQEVPSWSEDSLICKHLTTAFSMGLANGHDHGHAQTRLERYIVQYLSHFVAQSSRCPAASKYYEEQLLKVATAVGDSIQQMERHGASAARDLVLYGESKKRRLDEDYKVELLQTAMENKRAKTPMAIARASGGIAVATIATWVGPYMGKIRAAIFMAFKGAQSVAVAFDAGRVGSPKEETLLLVAMNVETRQAAWLAPQALRHDRI